jgi:threonine/homoserine efflux transporter RhtA
VTTIACLPFSAAAVPHLGAASILGAIALGQGLAAPQVVGILAVVAAGILVLREVPAAD